MKVREQIENKIKELGYIAHNSFYKHCRLHLIDDTSIILNY